MRFLILPPMLFLASAVLMYVVHRLMPVAPLLEHPWNWVGLAPAVAGFVIANWHARLFRRIGTNIDTFGEPGTLTTAGLFRCTRNPMYLGFVFSLGGLGLLLGSAGPFVVVAAFTLLTHFWYIPVEERAMQAKFGEQYAEYRRQVRRWL